jgi:uncharacterized protein
MNDNQITMPLDWDQGELAAGLHCYCHQEFFAAHEHWEAVWLRSPEPEKAFLQAVIQIAAAFHHLQRNNAIGAASLLQRSLRRLDAYPQDFAGLAVEPLRQSLRAWLQALSSNHPSPPLPFPTIC